MEFFKANIIPGEVFVQLIAFILVFWTLKFFAWKPLQKALESRRHQIASEFEKIESAKKDVESLRQEYQAHLKKIEDEARGKIQEAIHEGRRVAREIQEKARSESQATFEKAKENLAIEIAKSRLELRQEIAQLAISASERIIKEKMNDAKQQEKVAEILGELEKNL